MLFRSVQGTLKSLIQLHSSKASVLQHSAFFMIQLSYPYMTTGKTIALTRWAFLGKVITNKASGDDGISAELFQILKDNAVKVLHSICQQIRKLSSGHRTGKGQFSSQSQRQAMPKNAQTTAQLHSFHMLAK